MSPMPKTVAKLFVSLAYLALMLPVATSLAATAAPATSSTPITLPAPSKPPAKPKVLAPITAPLPSNDATVAYEFRTKLYGHPPCSGIGSEADSVFLDATLSMEAKVMALKRIESQARAAGCIMQ